MRKPHTKMAATAALCFLVVACACQSNQARKSINDLTEPCFAGVIRLAPWGRNYEHPLLSELQDLDVDYWLPEDDNTWNGCPGMGVELWVSSRDLDSVSLLLRRYAGSHSPVLYVSPEWVGPYPPFDSAEWVFVAGVWTTRWGMSAANPALLALCRAEIPYFSPRGGLGTAQLRVRAADLELAREVLRPFQYNFGPIHALNEVESQEPRVGPPHRAAIRAISEAFDRRRADSEHGSGQ